MPRGSVSSKKRESTGEASPMLEKKKLKSATPSPPQMQQVLVPHVMDVPDSPPGGLAAEPFFRPVTAAPTYLPPNGLAAAPPYQSQPITRLPRESSLHSKISPHVPTPPPQITVTPDERQPPIDPGLFSAYSEQTSYPESTAPFVTDGDYFYNPPVPQFDFQSLEQIANEVLDMNGRQYDDSIFDMTGDSYHHNQGYNASAPHAAADDSSQHEDSVDSGVAIPKLDLLNDATGPETKEFFEEANEVSLQALPTSHAPAKHDDNDVKASVEPSVDKGDELSSIPLYKPPPPVSLSPELTKRVPHARTPSHDATSQKRKREGLSATPGSSTKRVRVDEEAGVRVAETETDDERVARMLQQEELGLRRR